MKEFYEKNADFRDYVDRYCKKTHVSVDEALEHDLIKEVAKYYGKESI